MAYTALRNFRSHQNTVLDGAQRKPVEILRRGTRRRAVVVSPEFFDRALEALEDAEDAHAAAAARSEQGRVTHTQLMNELGL